MSAACVDWQSRSPTDLPIACRVRQVGIRSRYWRPSACMKSVCLWPDLVPVSVLIDFIAIEHSQLVRPVAKHCGNVLCPIVQRFHPLNSWSPNLCLLHGLFGRAVRLPAGRYLIVFARRDAPVTRIQDQHVVLVISVARPVTCLRRRRLLLSCLRQIVCLWICRPNAQ